MFRTPVSIVLLRCHGWKSVCIGFGASLALEKFPGGGGGGGDTEKIASTPNSSLRLFKLS